MAVALSVAASPVSANCGPSEQVDMRLASRHSEVPVGSGMKKDHLGRLTVIRLWVSPEGSFTLTESSPQGITCLLLSGQEFYLGPPNFPKPGEQG